jgi:hypothetical protein
VSKKEALSAARRLVQEAVEVAHRAGIEPAEVVAPHCAGTGDEQGAGQMRWCGEPVIIDDSTVGLFEMPEPDADPEQQFAFIVTQATADLVRQDFERYKPSLEIMAKDWQEKKALILFDRKGGGGE